MMSETAPEPIQTTRLEAARRTGVDRVLLPVARWYFQPGAARVPRGGVVVLRYRSWLVS